MTKVAIIINGTRYELTLPKDIAAKLMFTEAD